MVKGADEDLSHRCTQIHTDQTGTETSDAFSFVFLSVSICEDLWRVCFWNGSIQFRVPGLEFREVNSAGQLETLIETRNCLSFNADHLFDLSDDFNQIFLVLHHRLD